MIITSMVLLRKEYLVYEIVGRGVGLVPLAQCVNHYAGMVVLSRSHIDKLFGKDGGLIPLACGTYG